MKIEVFKTTAGCGHQESATLLKVAPLEYICVDIETKHPSEFMYKLGNSITDQHDDLFLSPVDVDIRMSSWYWCNPFLAEFFIEHKFEVTTAGANENVLTNRELEGEK